MFFFTQAKYTCGLVRPAVSYTKQLGSSQHPRGAEIKVRHSSVPFDRSPAETANCSCELSAILPRPAATNWERSTETGSNAQLPAFPPCAALLTTCRFVALAPWPSPSPWSPLATTLARLKITSRVFHHGSHARTCAARQQR